MFAVRCRRYNLYLSMQCQLLTKPSVKSRQNEFLKKSLKSTSVKNAYKKSIRDQKFCASTIFKIEYQSYFKNLTD